MCRCIASGDVAAVLSIPSVIAALSPLPRQKIIGNNELLHTHTHKGTHIHTHTLTPAVH